MEKERKGIWDNRGSLTVEAALFLIPFILAFCTIINAARFVQAEMLIHHAITQTAKQISTYSYVMTKTKITEKMQNTNGKSQQFTASVNEAVSSVEGFADAVENFDEIVEGAFSWVKSNGEQAVLTQVVGELSKNSIRNEISLLSDDPDEFLTNIGVVGGIAGLDFSGSKWISNSEGKGDIQIVVTYTMKNLIFPDFDFGQYEFCQCASTLTW